MTTEAEEACERGLTACSSDYDKAIAEFTEAIRLDPTCAEAYNHRGLAFIVKGDLDQGIADLTEAIRLNPKDALAYWNRGITYYEKTGDCDAAISDYTEAIRLNPNLAVAYNHRAYTYLQKREFEKAIADYTEAIRINPPTPTLCTGVLLPIARRETTRRHCRFHGGHSHKSDRLVGVLIPICKSRSGLPIIPRPFA